MHYIHISKASGFTRQQYDMVLTEIGPDPVTGQLLHIVGEGDGALHIIDVWQSKGHADRFASERLFPAFQRVGVMPGAAENTELQGTVAVGSPVEV